MGPFKVRILRNIPKDRRDHMHKYHVQVLDHLHVLFIDVNIVSGRRLELAAVIAGKTDGNAPIFIDIIYSPQDILRVPTSTDADQDIPR